MPRKLPPGKGIALQKRRPAILFLDDSHSGGRILDKNLNPIPTSNDGLKPISNVGGITVHPEHYDELLYDFTSLRRRLGDEIGLTELPNFHMRQLWGANPARDKGKNPFVELTKEDRYYWSRQLGELISKYSNVVRAVIYSVNIIDSQREYSRFFTQTDILLSHRLISAHFGKGARDYFDIVMNPLPGLIAYSMGIFGEYCEANRFSGTFVYDTTGASKGFDALESYSIARNLGLFKYLDAVRAGNCKDVPELQLADFISYTAHRKYMAEHNKVIDVGIEKLLHGLDIRFVTWGQSRRHQIMNAHANRTAVMLHYELGIQRLRAIDPQWVADHMLTPLELLQAMTGVQESSIGVNVIRPNKQPK